MKRLLVLAFVLSLVAVACGNASEQSAAPTTQAEESASLDSGGATAPQPEDDQTSSTSTAEATEPQAPRAEGPQAPDYTLALDGGGEFVLSQEVKPVYMVFWAEW